MCLMVDDTACNRYKTSAKLHVTAIRIMKNIFMIRDNTCSFALFKP